MFVIAPMQNSGFADVRNEDDEFVLVQSLLKDVGHSISCRYMRHLLCNAQFPRIKEISKDMLLWRVNRQRVSLYGALIGGLSLPGYAGPQSVAILQKTLKSTNAWVCSQRIGLSTSWKQRIPIPSCFFSGMPASTQKAAPPSA
jgi:hypothetical protein